MSVIRYIAIHHTGGTQADPKASTKNTTAEDVNAFHKQKWNFKSELGAYGGYNFFIEKGGDVVQFRNVGEETAAVIGHNKDTISICLAGNFTDGADVPTKEQKDALVDLIRDIFVMQANSDGWFGRSVGTIFDIDVSRIVPHRFFAKTQCNGMTLPDSWARDLYLSEVHEFPAEDLEVIELQYKVIKLLEKLIAFFKKKKAGGIDRECDGFIS